MRLYRFGALVLILMSWTVSAAGQTGPHAESPTSWTFDTHTPGPCSATGARHGGCTPGERVKIAVTTIASGLVQPWHVTFLPGTSDVLVTELPGRLRIIRNGVLDPAPVPGWPTPSIPSRSLHSLVLHPRFADNRTVYLTYVKGKDAAAAHADDGRDCARPLRRQGAVGGRTDLRGRCMGRRLVASARGVRARWHAVLRGGRPRQPEQQR